MACTSTGADTATLLDCIKAVCQQSAALVEELEAAQAGSDSVTDLLIESGAVLKCVINGAIDTVCDLPEGGQLPTLAEKLDNLNACTIATISGDSFVATTGQTVFTLGAAPINAFALEVSLDGAICRYADDYSVVGTTLTFSAPLVAGDTVECRRFTV